MNLARQETGAARIGGQVYVVGGIITAAPTSTDTVEVYDIALDQWTFAPSMPVALDHMGVVALNGQLWVIGGFSADFVPRSQVWIFDPTGGTWSAGPPLPSPRGGCWAVAHSGRIIVLGGTDTSGAATASTFLFDPGSGQWSSGASMRTAREHLTAVTAGAFVYAIGGRGNGLGARDVHERYDPASDQWTSLAPMPTKRSAMATAVVGERIVVAGGEIPMLHSVTEVYDIPSDTWHTQTAMPIPRHGVAAISIDGGMLVPAGATAQFYGATSAVDFFEPGPLIELNGTPQQGQTVSFGVRVAPSFEIGSRVLVALSCTGTSGIPLPGGRSLPLTFDTCTALGLQFGPLLQTTIDGSGQGTTPAIPFPAAPVGLTVRAAALTWDPNTGTILSTTSPIQFLTQ
ncbi:MAG: kelch repeat-containing protein [Planctomycetota bacterium]